MLFNRSEMEEWEPLPADEWCATLKDVGKIAINFRSYAGQGECLLFLVFEELQASVVNEGTSVILHSHDNPEAALHLNLSDDNTLMFRNEGILAGNYWQHYREITFVPLKSGEYSRITSHRKEGSEYNRFHCGGHLRALQSSLPDWLINVAAQLFKINQYTMPSILQHPALRPDTLRDMAAYAFTRDYPNHYLRYVARHPNTPADLLQNLYATVASAEIWHAVAENQAVPEIGLAQYIERVKNLTPGSDETIHIWNEVVDDPQCPVELLVWFAERNWFLEKILRHADLPQKQMYAIFSRYQTDEIRESLAANPVTPDDLLYQVIQTSHQKTLQAAQERPVIAPRTLQEVLLRLATHPDWYFRGCACRDKRITPRIIAVLLQDQEQHNRMILAQNPTLSFDDLCTLARDPYRVVSEAARTVLQQRFPQQAVQILAGLPPLSSLNSARDQAEEKRQAQRNTPEGRRREYWNARLTNATNWLRRYGSIILGWALIGMIVAFGIGQPLVAAVLIPVVGLMFVFLLWPALSDAGDWFSMLPLGASSLILLSSGGLGLFIASQTPAVTGIAFFFKGIAFLLNGALLALSIIFTPFALTFGLLSIPLWLMPLVSLGLRSIWWVFQWLWRAVVRKKRG